MVRSHIAGKPHEADVITAELFYTTAGIDITQISIDKNLEHHAWVVRRTTFRRILTVKFFKVYLSNDAVNNPDRTGSFRGIKSPEHGGKSRLSSDV